MSSTKSSPVAFPEEYLWVEKYRPRRIQDCILPDTLKKTFQSIVSGKEMSNLLLSGTGGLGKTTVAQAMCIEMGLDYLKINGSEESGIDVLRTKIRDFASTVSLEGSGGPKVVILDEADYLNPQSTQPALRGFIEEFSSNCRFILTCNFKNRIIEQLHSRCSVIEFNTSKKTLVGLAEQFYTRTLEILKAESVQYTEQVVAEVVMRFAPDWRRVLNELQRYSLSGPIDTGILTNLIDVNISSLMKMLKEKDFKNMRGWVANNMDTESAVIFRKLFDCASEYAAPSSIPQIVLILAEYQYKAAFVADHELNMVACLTEIMGSAEWKK